ncbi:hypothetical protein EHF36_10390 [Kerstersia gyiorum]|uniref:hypothetical protein n=1 Tax=Kerstersia gyiorum TaxID=206506 RepID=UPI001070D836|nr:hypothetical protein [Kerstersia gyiorum]QBR40992.1 hypothetical protein EHF36_10390 [Kerstersia gyiorum]
MKEKGWECFAVCVFTILLVGLSMLFLWKPPGNSSEMAAWVQAIGSILAVAVAVYLSYFQIDRAAEMHIRSEDSQSKRWAQQVQNDAALRRQRLESLKAIVERLQSVMTPIPYAIDGPNLIDGDVLLDLRLSTSIDDLRYLVDALRSVDTLTLGTYDRTRYLIVLICSCEKLYRTWTAALDNDKDRDDLLSLASSQARDSIENCKSLMIALG